MDNNKIIESINKSFIGDDEKMADFFMLTKDEFLKSYSYITEEEWEATRTFVEFVAESFKKYSRAIIDGAVRRHKTIWDPGLADSLLAGCKQR